LESRDKPIIDNDIIMEGNELELIKKCFDDIVAFEKSNERSDRVFYYNNGRGMIGYKENLILRNRWKFIDQRETILNALRDFDLEEHKMKDKMEK
jgi:hypothetical protein